MDFNSEVLSCAKELGVQWPVKVILDRGQITCRCATDAVAQEHNVWVDRYTQDDPSGRLYLVKHEVCHLYLAEVLDAAFCDVQFGWMADKETQRQLYLTWCLVDFWVNQLRNKVYPKAGWQEHTASAHDLNRLAKAYTKGVPVKTEMLLCIALTIAESDLHGYGAVPINKLRDALYGKGDWRVIMSLVKVLKELPALEALLNDKKSAIEQLELLKMTMTGQLGFQVRLFSVRLRYNEAMKRHVWLHV